MHNSCALVVCRKVKRCLIVSIPTFVSALWVVNSCATSILLRHTTRWRGVWLFTSLASTSALWVINSCAAPVLLYLAARWRGFWLFAFLASISALWVINNCPTAVLLIYPARWRGVHFNISQLRTSGETPSKRSRLTILASPVSTAKSRWYLVCYENKKQETTNIKAGGSCPHSNFQSKFFQLFLI